jgi:alkanesulfonate monooxygenase SsuD/methylene tetrahydromethanopterin reductase-like flavin-dependent oxidoreductase (luciferase family)
MSDYGRRVEFGLSLVPNAADIEESRVLARRADALGLDLIGIQDHPYQRRYVETWALLADLLARTERIRAFTDVANLPLRLPALIAKQAASLDVLSGGRFELGLGAGAFWEAIGAMGGPVRSGREALEALEEAVQIIRLSWSGERAIRFEGVHYAVAGLHPGPPPAHGIGIWLGVYKPRALALTGRLADGWVPSLRYAPPEAVPELQRRIDDGAAQAGRDPTEIRRVYNVGSVVSAEELTGFVLELGFDTLVFWPEGDDLLRQTERFAEEVAPAVRDAVASARGRQQAAGGAGRERASAP